MSVTTKGVKSILVRPCIVVLDTFWVSVRQETSLRVQLLGNDPTICNKYEDGAICWPEHPALRRLPEGVPSIIRDIWVKDGKQQYSIELHRFYESGNGILRVFKFLLLFTQLSPKSSSVAKGSGGGMLSLAKDWGQERPCPSTSETCNRAKVWLHPVWRRCR